MLFRSPSTHCLERNLYKQCVLGVGYGMEEHSLALRIDRHLLIARNLLRHHHEIFWQFWEWSDNRVRRTLFTNITYTVFGWKYHVTLNPKVRSIRNFPMQANGAEMLRLACCLATERGIEVCAPVHDAVLICAPLGRFEDDVARIVLLRQPDRALKAEDRQPRPVGARGVGSVVSG